MGYTGEGQSERVSRGTDTFQYDWNDEDVLSSTIAGTTTYYTYTPDGMLLDERITNGSYAGNYYYLLDRQDSVVGLANASGGLANSYSYDSYGNMIQSTGSAPNPFLWLGAIQDANTGWYHMGERYYQPLLARFTQADSGCISGSTDYVYAQDNPITLSDTSGNSPQAHGRKRKRNPNRRKHIQARRPLSWRCQACIAFVWSLHVHAGGVWCDYITAPFGIGDKVKQAICFPLQLLGHGLADACSGILDAFCSLGGVLNPYQICKYARLC